MVSCRTLPSPLLLTYPSLSKFSSSMASHTHSDSSKNQLENDPKSLVNYPVPLSPPLPYASKDIELRRAMSASSRSGLFSLSRNDLLFEDEWLVAVNKPQGVYCESVLSSVLSLLGGSGNSDELELHLANRLDRDTSGVTIITKSHKIAAKLVKVFTNHKVRKTYIAFCVGCAPTWQKITIRSGHGRSKFGVWRIYAVNDVGKALPGGSSVKEMETQFEVLSVDGRNCYKDSFVVGLENGEARVVEEKSKSDFSERKHEIPVGEMGSNIEVLSVNEKNCSEDLSEVEEEKEEVLIAEEKSRFECGGRKNEILVRAYPRSGRTHQIRLHCRYLGIPIRGDVKYEGVYEWKGKDYDFHELHAESLSLEHPVTGLPLLVRAPLPLWATQVLLPSSN